MLLVFIHLYRNSTKKSFYYVDLFHLKKFSKIVDSLLRIYILNYGTLPSAPFMRQHSYFFVCLSIYMFICLSASLFMYLSTCLSASLSVYLPVDMSLCLSTVFISLSDSLLVCLSVIFSFIDSLNHS